MSCVEFEEKITALVDGELRGKDLGDTESHISQCGHCASVLEANRAVKRMVAERMPREVAPIHLRARIRRELDKETAKAPVWRRLSRFFTFNPMPAYVAAAVLLIAVGFGLGRFTSSFTNNTASVAGVGEHGQPIALEGHLVCINCALHGQQGHPVFCKEHNHVLGIKLADGSIWSILENDKASSLRTDYADMHKTVTIEGMAFPNAKYVEIKSFKVT